MKRISSNLFLAISFSLSIILISCFSTENKKAPKTEQELSDEIRNSLLDSINKSSGVFNENNLIGNWTVAELLNENKLREMMQLTSEEKVTMSLTGKSSYFEGGTCSSEGKMELNLTEANSSEPITLTIDFEVTATWIYKNNRIIETIVDSRVNPSDEATSKIMDENKDLSKSLLPLKGSSTSSKVLSFTKNIIETEDDETKSKMTMRKIN